MSKIFIAWSGNSPLAKKLAEVINRQQSYHCVVGGNLQGVKKDIYVGGTIIAQMRECDQAILLIQKHGKTGKLSPNLMFEWGYLLSKLHTNKLHNYFIDLDLNDDELPSDLHGVWAYKASTLNKTEEELANELAARFFKSQVNEVKENKMSVIYKRDETRAKIRSHNSNPVYSNYEMAQYIMCYVYTASIFGDAADWVKSDITEFANALSPASSVELKLAVKFVSHTLNLYGSIKRGSIAEYVSLDDFYNFRDGYDEILDRVADLEDSELKLMLDTFCYNFINYLYLLILGGNELSDEKRAEYCQRMYEISVDTIVKCNTLEEMDPELNKEIGVLLRAYMYRNKYCALEILEKLEAEERVPRTQSTEERNAQLADCLFNSFKERRELFFTYSEANVPSGFRENIEMEYYLAMAECMLYETDQKLCKDYKRKLERYVSRTTRAAEEKMVFTNRIKGYLNKFFGTVGV